MIFHKFIPILLLFIVFEIDALHFETRFNFLEKINCVNEKYWWYQIGYWEVDTYSKNDRLAASELRVFEGQNHETFITTATEDIDEMIPDLKEAFRVYYQFELQIYLYHNCTYHGATYEIHNLGKWKVNNEAHNITVCRVLDQPNLCKKR